MIMLYFLPSQKELLLVAYVVSCLCVSSVMSMGKRFYRGTATCLNDDNTF